jgi:hypothetical protein
MNLWTAAAKGWLPPGSWAACALDVEATTGGWLACDVSMDGQRWVGVRARPDGTVATAFVVNTEPECWSRISEHLDDDTTVSLAIAPPLEVHLPERYARRARTVGYQEIREWTGLVRNAILDRRVHHSGETLLAEHVERAVGVYANNALTVASNKSPGPIELCRCMIWAWALATVPSRKRKAAIAFG